MEAALGKISDEARGLIVLRHQEGRPFGQIAEALIISEDTARKRWVRTIEELWRSTQDDTSSAESA